MGLFFVLGWVALCGVVAWVASEKGRSGVGFFFLSFFFSPLIGILIAIALPSLAPPPRSQPAGPMSGNDLVLCPHCNRPGRFADSTCRHCGKARQVLPVATTKVCPICAETIQLAAIKCRFCGAEQSSTQTGG
jgi:hypothetical protein